MNEVHYLLGAFAVFIWRWMNWLKNQDKGVLAWAYWTDRPHIATNVTSGIVTLFTVGLWTHGFLANAIDAAIPDNFVPPGSLTVVWYLSGPAGFFVTWGTRRIVKWLNATVGDNGDEPKGD